MRSQKGQSVVEMALILPLLMLILTGILDFGTVIHTDLILDHAGREAARAASLGESDAAIQQIAQSQASSLDVSSLTIAISPDVTSRKEGTYATVTLSYSIHFLTPMVGLVLPDPFVLQNKTVMRVE